VHIQSLLSIGALILLSAASCSKAPSAEQAAPAATEASAAAAQPPKPMPAELPDVLARVNDQPVTKAEFDRLIRNMEAGAGPIPAERRDEILRTALDQLITYNVMKQEAASRKIAISEAEIDAQVHQMQAQFPSEAEFQEALGARNMSLEQLKADARVDMLIERMVEAEAATAAAASEADARTFYEGNPDQFAQGESVRASHILVMAKEEADEATKARARAKIEAVLKQARAGEDFAALAREHSDDGSKEQGGDLGYFERGRMVPPFDEAAFALEPGQMSDVVTTPFGYHIIKVVDKKPGETVPYDAVKDKIIEYLNHQKRQQQIESFVQDARKRARIEVLV